MVIVLGSGRVEELYMIELSKTVSCSTDLTKCRHQLCRLNYKFCNEVVWAFGSAGYFLKSVPDIWRGN